MSLAAKAIKAVLQNNDFAEFLTEDKVIFGKDYEDVYDFIVEYYDTYDTVPNTEVIEDHFDDYTLFDGVSDNLIGSTKHYLSELRVHYMRTSIRELLLSIDANLEKKTPEEVLDRMASKTAELSKHITRSRDIDITDIDVAIEHFKEVRERVAEGRAGIMTGIPVWDEFVPGGLEPGMSTVLIGYSGRAKSWIADLIAAHAYSCGKKVLIISLEMNEDQQRNRVYAILGKGQFTMRELQTAEASDEKLQDFASERLDTGGNIWVVDTEGVGEMTPNIVRAKIDKFKPDLVIIDYLQLMSDNGRSKEMTPRMLNLSKEIKGLAMQCNVAMLTISAVTDDSDNKKQDTPPTGQQVAWSKGIMYDADLVVAAHLYLNTPILELVCRKQRNGQLFDMQFHVDLGRGIFEPYYGEET